MHEASPRYGSVDGLLKLATVVAVCPIVHRCVLRMQIGILDREPFSGGSL